jgi:predicted enzyme related to lactoylglutathione lyase
VRLNQVTLPAVDITASVAFYRTMGFELIVDSPHYARFKSSEGDATFSVHKVDEVRCPPQTVVYFETTSLDETVKRLQAKGLSFSQEPRDEPWLWREARIIDPAGNVICLFWAGANRLNPPWRVGA